MNLWDWLSLICVWSFSQHYAHSGLEKQIKFLDIFVIVVALLMMHTHEKMFFCSLYKWHRFCDYWCYFCKRFCRIQSIVVELSRYKYEIFNCLSDTFNSSDCIMYAKSSTKTSSTSNRRIWGWTWLWKPRFRGRSKFWWIWLVINFYKKF